jgi:hypothetical protein
MLYKPSTNTRSKRGLFGIVTTTGQSGPHMRRLAFPVQTRSAPALAWRQIFLATKQNWLALSVGAANVPDPNVVDPASAWAMTNAQYNGVYSAGLITNGVQEMGHMGPCDTGEAYFTMVQANRAAMGLAPLPTPATTSTQANPPASSFLDTYGTVQVFSTATQPTQPGPLSAVLAVGANDSSSANASLAVTVTAAPSDVTVSWSGSGSAATTLTQTSYIVVPQILTVTIPANYAAGSLSLSLNFTANGGPQTIPLAFTVTAPGVQLVDIPATFAFPNSAGCSTEYDNTMTVTGFMLTYSWAGSSTYPTTKYDADWPGVWEVLASASYTSSYSPPAANTWVPILFSGPYLPTPGEILAAWVGQFGDLPDTGNIKFQLQYIDTDSGASGPALSCTGTWENGTLTGFDRSSWSGPLFAWHIVPDDTTVTAPGTQAATIAVYGFNGYGGTITFTPKSNTIVATGYNSTKKAFGQGMTITVSPASVTIPTGSTTPLSATVTMTAADWSQRFSGTVRISATDGLSTTSAQFNLAVGGDVIPQPPPNYLTISPGVATPAVNNPGTTAVALTLTNSGPDDLQPSMLAGCSDGTVGLTFDVPIPDLPPATVVILDTPPITVAGSGALMDGSGSQFSPAIPYTGDFTGWYIQTTGWAPASLNQGPEPVTSSSGGIFHTATTGSTTTPTTVGSIVLTNPNNVSNTPAPSFTQTTPSTAVVNLSIDIPAAIDTYGLGVQVEASAGTNAAKSIVSLS